MLESEVNYELINLSNIFLIDYRVYIAGILVPASSVNISGAFNTPSTATVTLPPYPELYGIGRHDRIPVHIFIRETWKSYSEYVLLYEGEITDFSYISSKVNRELVVNSQALLSVLKDVNIRILTSFEDMVRNKVVRGENNLAVNNATPGIVYPLSLFMYGLGEVKPDNLITTPSEYLKNTYTFLQEPNADLKGDPTPVLTKFYEDYAAKIKLTQRYIELPYYDEEGAIFQTGEYAGTFPLIDGIQKSAAIEQLKSVSNSAMSSSRGPVRASLYDLLDYVVSQMQYEFSFISSPRYDTDEDRLVSSCLKPIFYEAAPPKCNIIYRSQVESIQTNEFVHQVPTRARIINRKGPINSVTNMLNDIVNTWSIVDYYPSELYETTDPSYNDSMNWFVSEILEQENYTGAYTFETDAPSWMSYIKPSAIPWIDSGKELKQLVMHYLLLLKQYDRRRIQVQCGFNPYITPGFPGVACDSEDNGFIFVGHVVSVNHNLSKHNPSTTVIMSFVRTIEEATTEGSELANIFPALDETNKDVAKMSEIYQKLLGCDAVSLTDVRDIYFDSTSEAQNSPGHAYINNNRSIVTFDEYCSFMGLTTEDFVIQNEDGEYIPTVMDGDFVDKRWNKEETAKIVSDWNTKYADDNISQLADSLEGIRLKLKAIYDKEMRNKIYE
jgi:hypothetical protein